MVRHGGAFHHFHRRKRIYKKHEPYPHPDPVKRFFDKAIYAVALAGPLLTIPQVLKIWVEKNAAGVSLVTWSAYIFLAFFWLAYGIIHREKPIIIDSVLWILLEILVVMGIIFYG